jgi:hypothetical protein
LKLPKATVVMEAMMTQEPKAMSKMVTALGMNRPRIRMVMLLFILQMEKSDVILPDDRRNRLLQIPPMEEIAMAELGMMISVEDLRTKDILT